MEKKVIWGSLAGTVAFFLLGWLVYGVLLMGYFESQSMLEGVNREMPDFLYLIIGNLAMAAFLALILGQWARAQSMGEGIKIGMIAGLLFAAAFDFIMYSTTNIMSLQAAIVDIVVSTVVWGIVASIQMMVMGSSQKAATA